MSSWWLKEAEMTHRWGKSPDCHLVVQQSDEGRIRKAILWNEIDCRPIHYRESCSAFIWQQWFIDMHFIERALPVMNWYERQLIWFYFNWNYFFPSAHMTTVECAGALTNESHQMQSASFLSHSNEIISQCFLVIMKMKCSLSGSIGWLWESETLEIGDMGTWESWALWVGKTETRKAIPTTNEDAQYLT